ncbi:hypothetical protein AURDEDRAFT_164504 [Auricularia subglabra TFB-10046 SS5]|nr:hypothetical protein AURDEDRAFT_164504 [Auricularia subglabra TFB-10046 SS5]
MLWQQDTETQTYLYPIAAVDIDWEVMPRSVTVTHEDIKPRDLGLPPVDATPAIDCGSYGYLRDEAVLLEAGAGFFKPVVNNPADEVFATYLRSSCIR